MSRIHWNEIYSHCWATIPIPTSIEFSSCKTVPVCPLPSPSHPLAATLPLPLSVNMRKQECHESGIVHIWPPVMGSFPKLCALKMPVIGPSRCQNTPLRRLILWVQLVLGGGGEGWQLPAHWPWRLLPWRLRLHCRAAGSQHHIPIQFWEPGTHLQLLLGVRSSSWPHRQLCSFHSAGFNTGHMSNFIQKLNF